MASNNKRNTTSQRVNYLVIQWRDGLATPAEAQELSVAIQRRVKSLQTQVRIPEGFMSDAEDIASVGVCAAFEAMNRWKTTGTDFLTFSYARIRGAMIDYLRSIDPIPRNSRVQLGEIGSSYERLSQKNLSGNVTIKQVADDTGFSQASIERILSLKNNRFSQSLFSKVSDTTDDTDIVLNYIPQDDDKPRVRLMAKDINTLLARLPKREASIMWDYYIQDISQRDIAEKYNLTEARISQIRQASLTKLKELSAQLLEQRANG